MDSLGNMMGKQPVQATGTMCAVGKLYRHTESSSWSLVQDPVLHQQQVSGLGQSYAMVHRYSMQKLANGTHTWTTHSIAVNSEKLKAILAQIFQGYPDWAPADKPFTFLPPYKPLIHRWEKIRGFNAADEGAKKELHLFCEEVKPLIEVELHVLEKTRSTGVIPFDKLWLIFAPGDLVIAGCLQGATCICKLLAAPKLITSTRDQRRRLMRRGIFDSDDSEDESDDEDGSDKPFWAIQFAQIDWNGSYCGQKVDQIKILQFDEIKAVTDLDMYPLLFSPDLREKDMALARGRKFESLRGFHVKNCNGAKIIEKPTPFGTEYVPEPVSGRVIVDAHAFYHCQEKVPPTLRRAANPELSAEEDVKVALSLVKKRSGDDERREDLRPMTDEECILAVPRVKGFDLRTKQWCYFNVDELQETSWNDASYDNLVLPVDEKELLMSFADKERVREAGFDDFVKNKGKGVIILLYGPAGVGKTLTAEGVAEKSRVPLYVLSAGELGSTAGKVEGALQTALKCCQLWGAMLLLDEADVFLEARGSDNVERNELVSIFLRQLEYYQGLMFLTTNRVKKIDNAFLSRIDLILPYDDLDLNTRRELWAKFVHRLKPQDVDLSKSDIDDLATTKMNGREIKNVLKTALIIAARDKPLRKRHLQTVLSIRKRVDSLRLDAGGIVN
ncbi:P-loop containing nucleoside triphosphate hydrolase protein [Hypoxylon trugodes]|uniref:P-loop containing nucleoside triphosphate hydrolase protein n=1 Tax=Hypoxylon trugodes TaxID=326681 RepID=UPI0021A19943|nr:P-loop containing nucleoside triphosphate hydrolase protein [Hypoxylon trugodes]KAI1392918.1 P-loop containing nucleoside triphosphate hydrolase protein [Hypoxylon trugodes]